MSLIRCEQETNVYDNGDNLLGQIDNSDTASFPIFRATNDSQFTIDELREIADYLESL